MEQYLNPDDQGDLKSMLYSYLKDKAQRRAGVTSKSDYEGAEKQFVDQMRLRDMGGLAGGLSEAASMAGTLGGKRAKSDIIPDLNKDLYGSTQGAYENFRTLRDTEERSNMNDLNVARYLTGLEQAGDADKMNRRRQDFSEQQYKEQAPNRDLQRQMLRQKLQSQRIDPNLQWEDGSPVVMGPDGQPARLPTGIKYRDKVRPEDPNADLERELMRARIGQIGAQTDATRTRGTQQKPLGSSDKARLDNINMAGRSIDSVEQFFTKNKPSKDILGRIGGRIGNATTMGSTDYDLAADMWEEAIGRMQSGGAITDSEGTRFRRLFPKFEDSPEMINKKINEMRFEMNSRRKTLGQSPAQEDSGFPKRIRKGGKSATVQNQQELEEAISEGWGE